MDTEHLNSPASLTDTLKQPSKSECNPIGQNIESILAFYAREEQCVTRSQRMLETVLDSLGRPIYLGVVVLFCAIWILANVLLDIFGKKPFDVPPFFGLQGIVGLMSLLIMIVVLVKQNRLARIEERRAHLELQINLLTEHKTAKLIKLLMELRRDMPMIKNRRDLQAAAFQNPTYPEAVLAALDEHLGSEIRGDYRNKGVIGRFWVR
ncbi:MAG: DUF1003 domain-containing protein [Oxalobacter sp.]|nr:MAG: DUF1003 domain-containing protein [Oxalobacter sp.]